MPTDQRPLAVFLMGPTASGKTALACTLADHFVPGACRTYGIESENSTARGQTMPIHRHSRSIDQESAEIWTAQVDLQPILHKSDRLLDLISVDSALVYRGMDIGTAKPDAATLARYPHALIDIREPAQTYSAADFRDDALLAMHASAARGRVPLLVGGTGLYFRALQHGLSPLPAADPALRQRFEAEAASLGWPALHARLASLDAVAAQRIGANDSQRIQRALEVIEMTGQALSAQQGGARSRFGFRVLKLALMPARDVLHQRIGARFDAMLADGFIEEMRGLRARGDLQAQLPSMRAVGYRQAWRYLDDELDAPAFRAAAVAATRQLAKRQVTWLRAQRDARWLTGSAADVATQAIASIRAFLA